MPERIDESYPYVTRKLMESVKSDSASQRAVFDVSQDIPEIPLPTLGTSETKLRVNVSVYGCMPMCTFRFRMLARSVCEISTISQNCLTVVTNMNSSYDLVRCNLNKHNFI